MHKAVFTTNGFEYPHIGYTSGRRWNGWATPYFEVDEALQVMQEYNECREETEQMTYDKENDMFIVRVDGYDEDDYWKGTNYQTEEGIKHLYGIGAYSWVWEYTTQDDIRTVAQGIEDFLFEFDTYEHRDNYDDREDLLHKLIEQLRDFKTLKQAIKIFYNEDLTSEEMFNKLREVLSV